MGDSGAERSEIVEITTTVSTEEEAERLVRPLLDERLVACANLRRIRSLYRWRGALCDEAEIEIVLKTEVRWANRVEEVVRERHPYETPAILRTTVASANPDYARWVAESTERQDES